eukprot:Lithocolla_globosa_v1_NODE_1179_length_2806_cov_6.192294.p3 type:complete len:113 gc:universal NODE_1179_length_2806_cov_6.192294:350-12(-)
MFVFQFVHFLFAVHAIDCESLCSCRKLLPAPPRTRCGEYWTQFRICECPPWRPPFSSFQSPVKLLSLQGSDLRVAVTKEKKQGESSHWSSLHFVSFHSALDPLFQTNEREKK